MNPRGLAQGLCPPVFLEFIRRVRGARSSAYVGDYPTWAEADRAAVGYDVPEILRRVRQSTLKVKCGEAVFERDSVCFHYEEYRWPTLACLLRIAAENGGRLRVLDFGGALGSFWFQHRKLLQGLREMRWAVVEQPHYVACGREDFEDEVLTFHETIDGCLQSGAVDVIFLSSVLQYLSEPYTWLQRFSESGIRWLLLDRTPFIENDRDRLTVQRVPPSIYPASYPAWFFSRPRFDEKLGRLCYRECVRFDAIDDVGIGRFEGILLEKVS